jgi:hypothetical protein
MQPENGGFISDTGMDLLAPRSPIGTPLVLNLDSLNGLGGYHKDFWKNCEKTSAT